MAKVYSMIGGGSGGGSGLVPDRLVITGQPEKTDYKVGETFQTEGLKVELYYTNGMHFETEGYSISPSGPLKESDGKITVSVSENGKRVSADITINVTRTEIPVPSQSNSLTYNEGEQQPEWLNFDGEKMTKEGSESETDAGSYPVTFICGDAYTFPEGEHSKVVNWTIARAEGSVTVQPPSLELKPDQETAQATITRKGDGALTVEGGGTVCTASIEGENTLKVESRDKASGTERLTVKCAQSKNYEAAQASVEVKATFTTIYGVEWEGTQDTAWSRTDAAEFFEDPSPAVSNGEGSSPFDDLMPWKGMEVETRAGGEMVKIPKFWYKWTRSGVKMKLQIADGPADGFHVSPAHADRGDGKGERNEVYIARYHCASDYKSKTGGQPTASKTRAQFRTGIQALGTGMYMADFAMFWTVRMLYLVEYADWNGQKAIGYGCSPSNSIFNMGLTDNMTYHTGTTAKDRTTYGATQYRHIEGLWDNVYDWTDGIRFSGQDIYVITKPSEFSDTANGTKVGTRPTSSNYISAWIVPAGEGLDWALYPSAVGGTENNFVGDYCGYYSAGVVLYVGGYGSQVQYYGPFFLGGGDTASYQDSGIGSRSMELP